MAVVQLLTKSQVWAGDPSECVVGIYDTRYSASLTPEWVRLVLLMSRSKFQLVSQEVFGQPMHAYVLTVANSVIEASLFKGGFDDDTFEESMIKIMDERIKQGDYQPWTDAWKAARKVPMFSDGSYNLPWFVEYVWTSGNRYVAASMFHGEDAYQDAKKRNFPSLLEAIML